MAAGASGERQTERAIEEACHRAASALADAGGRRGSCDVAFVAFSPHHVAGAPAMIREITRTLAPRALIGVSAEAVISGGLELEAVPGVSVMAMSLPGVRVKPFSLDDLPLSLHADEPTARLDDEESDLASIGQGAGIGPGHRATILLADPFTAPVEALLPRLARARALAAPAGAGARDADNRNGPILGGMASAAPRRGGNALLLNDRVLRDGLVGLSLSGAIRADAVVSQGCKPLGPNLIVTSAKGPLIRTLSGRPALAVVHDIINELGEADKQLLARGLMLGRVVDEYKERFGRSDYLIQAVTGVSKDDGAIVLAGRPRVGQTVRFHARDARTADEDLAMLLDAQAIHGRPLGVLLFTCNGRGTRLFEHPHHDAMSIQRAFADPEAAESRAKGGFEAGVVPLVPLGGFFAAGEIGPVGDGVFLHGHTACAAVFRARTQPDGR